MFPCYVCLARVTEKFVWISECLDQRSSNKRKCYCLTSGWVSNSSSCLPVFHFKFQIQHKQWHSQLYVVWKSRAGVCTGDLEMNLDMTVHQQCNHFIFGWNSQPWEINIYDFFWLKELLVAKKSGVFLLSERKFGKSKAWVGLHTAALKEIRSYGLRFEALGNLLYIWTGNMN